MSLLEAVRNRKFPGTTDRRTGWIGVEVGTGAIRIAQLERLADQVRIARSLMVPASDNTLFDQRSIEEGRVGREIQEALALHGGFQGRLAACALSMHFCDLRTMVSVKGSEEQQREVIRLELADGSERDAPAREFDFWDASVRQDVDEQGMTQVHVMSIPEVLSDCLAKSMLRAGLKCEVLDAIPFTAMRAAEVATSCAPGDVVDNTVVVLDWDYSTATLVVMHQGQLRLTRALRHCGFNRVLEAIGRRLQLPRMEAEAVLTSCGLSTEPAEGAVGSELQELISDLAKDVLKELVIELIETFSFMQQESTDLVPTHVWLIGAGSGIANVAELLERQIGVPTRLWHLPARVVDSEQPLSALANAAALSALAWER